jgi:hypothetical protein
MKITVEMTSEQLQAAMTAFVVQGACPSALLSRVAKALNAAGAELAERLNRVEDSHWCDEIASRLAKNAADTRAEEDRIFAEEKRK